LRNILRDIFTVHHCTHSRISVFHSDLPTIKITLALRTIPHSESPTVSTGIDSSSRFGCLFRAQVGCPPQF
jgi:hypothetical protein